MLLSRKILCGLLMESGEPKCPSGLCSEPPRCFKFSMKTIMQVQGLIYSHGSPVPGALMVYWLKIPVLLWSISLKNQVKLVFLRARQKKIATWLRCLWLQEKCSTYFFFFFAFLFSHLVVSLLTLCCFL